jgi:hypothetical protein
LGREPARSPEAGEIRPDRATEGVKPTRRCGQTHGDRREGQAEGGPCQARDEVRLKPRTIGVAIQKTWQSFILG